MLHDNCLTGWLVFTQPRSHLHGGFAEPRTTGDVYVEESAAQRAVEACTGPDQAAWTRRVMVHLHH